MAVKVLYSYLLLFGRKVPFEKYLGKAPLLPSVRASFLGERLEAVPHLGTRFEALPNIFDSRLGE